MMNWHEQCPHAANLPGLQQAIEEASRNPAIILFIDEMHTVVGTESTVGDLDIASLLKPALGKGNLRCIGATTVENYRRYMEPDPFFERHCQAIVVNEPVAWQSSIDRLS